jgi:hypothetical protein
VHENLVVARECIHKTEQLILGGRVDQCVNAREGEVVFSTGPVEVGEVHTHPPLSIRLLHQDYVCQLVRVVDLLDKLSL